MDSINWAVFLVAMAGGSIVAGAFMALGLWLDRRREARWDRELNGDYAPSDIIPIQRDGSHDDDGA